MPWPKGKPRSPESIAKFKETFASKRIPIEEMSREQLYQHAHREVRRARGRAKDHECERCGSQACDWSLRDDDPTPGLRKSSLNVDDYRPLCRSCHLILDFAGTPEHSAWMKKAGYISSQVHVQCSCGRVTNPGGLARHQNATGHVGKTKIEETT